MGSLLTISLGFTFVQNSFLLLSSTNQTSTSRLDLYTISFVGLPVLALLSRSIDSFLKNAGLLLTYSLLFASICDMLERLLRSEDCLSKDSMLLLLQILGKELQRSSDWWLSTGMPTFLLADNYLLIQQQQLMSEASGKKGWMMLVLVQMIMIILQQLQSKCKEKRPRWQLSRRSRSSSQAIREWASRPSSASSPSTSSRRTLRPPSALTSSPNRAKLWDTAGQQKYRSLIKGYLRGANACVFVYDTNNHNTYTNLVEWMKTFEEVSKDEKTFVLVFGNKTDLPKDRAQFQKARREVAKSYTRMESILQIEGSAKEGVNIQQIFEEILQNFEETANSAKKIDSTKSIGQSLIKTFNKNGKSHPCCSM